ncbi:Jacalin-related lectin 25 [Raphanus sativus]|nr:Jacalin-related lectin 25 [Raphanus sativus]
MRMGPLGYMHKSRTGTEWDETGRTAISLIIVSFDNCSVTSIQFGFVENGKLVMSKTYGASGFSKRVIRLNHETEFVTGISGEIASGSGISSLTFHTNLREHEAFHLKIDAGEKAFHPWKRVFYSGIVDRREFEGFFGFYDEYRLLTINFFVTHILSDVKTIKNEK